MPAAAHVRSAMHTCVRVSQRPVESRVSILYILAYWFFERLIDGNEAGLAVGIYGCNACTLEL